MEGWKEYKASDFCVNVTDGTHDSPKPQSEGHYLITSKHLKDNDIDFSSANLISEEDYNKVITRSSVEKYDILYSMIGTIGNVVQVKMEHVDFAVKNMGIFKLGKDVTKSIWLYYWLKSPYSQEYVHQRLAGSTQSYLTLSSLRDFPILYPGEYKARKIAAILSSLDDKIENNNRINRNLEAQAQALFKSWFVDFEPWGGVMPEDWREGTLGEIADITSGKRPPMREATISRDAIIPIIGAADVIGYTNDTLYETRILVTGRVGTHGVVQRFDDKCWPSDNTLVIESNWYEYTYQVMGKIDFHNMNRGSTQPLITQTDLKNQKIVIPSTKVLDDYECMVGTLFRRISNNQRESQRLAALRDTLLPKLMKGEIEV